MLAHGILLPRLLRSVTRTKGMRTLRTAAYSPNESRGDGVNKAWLPEPFASFTRGGSILTLQNSS